MKKNLFKILKGILVGCGAILPGVSGGVIAAAFNIYEELIDSLNLVTKTPIRAIIKIWQYLLGITLGILIGFLLIRYIYEKFPLPFTFLFIGLILGSLFDYYIYIKKYRPNLRAFIAFGVGVFAILSITLLSVYLPDNTLTNTNVFLYYLFLFICGVIFAMSLVVPGVSGSMLLLAIGIYYFMVDTITDFTKGVLSFEWSLMGNNFFPLLTIGIGFIFGMILFGKIIKKVIIKIDYLFKYFIVGMIISSPIVILIDLANNEKFSNVYIEAAPITWIISSLLLLIGIILTWIFVKLQNKNEHLTQLGEQKKLVGDEDAS